MLLVKCQSCVYKYVLTLFHVQFLIYMNRVHLFFRLNSFCLLEIFKEVLKFNFEINAFVVTINFISHFFDY